MIPYETAKDWLVATTGITKDAWHIYFALMIQLAAAQLFPRRYASIGPLLVIAALELFNEWMDYQHYHAVTLVEWKGWAYDTVRDVINSLLVPTILFLVARLYPARLMRVDAVTVTSDEA